MKITFPDGSVKEAKTGMTPFEIVKTYVGEGLARAALAAKVNGESWDLFRPINNDSKLEIKTWKDNEGIEAFRHSTAHLLAQAVTELFPEAKPTIGPVVEEGFYYDFFHSPFTEEDLQRIEERMGEIVSRKLEVKRLELTKDEALKFFKNNKFKIELIKELPKDEKITAYQQGDFIDLCRGPHLPNTSMIKSFKLTKLAGAYWKGDANNVQLQRIYGISFPDKKELDEYLKRVAEAEKRDHKKIGREMELFMIHETIGKGLPVFLPKGETMVREMEKLAVETERKCGYVRVRSPHLAKQELFIKSGHLPHYEESMYPKMVMDDGTYYLKAMNCPMHHLVYNNKVRSYRDLPLRIAEYGTVYRNELSGTLSGLLRVRMISQNDAHIYCTKDQISSEFEKVIKMNIDYFNLFGFKDYYFRLSLWDPKNKEKYINEPENWKYSEDKLREILKKLKLSYVEATNEAAFYGPKVDIQFKTVIGREETMSTIQLDFAAKKRFELRYNDKDGNLNNEVFVIHRSPLSSHERFMAFVIEHYAGKFPLWLSPVQIKILPIADRHNDYCEDLRLELEEKGLRVEVDLGNERLNKKVRDAELQHVNYILVIGDKEIENKTVNIRTRDNKQLGEKNVEEFIEECLEEVKKRK